MGYSRIWESNGTVIDSDTFWVLEPGLNLELNLTKVLRFNFGASYRFVFDADLPGVENNNLSDVAVTAGLKIGWY